ncbi:hypothetical protein [Gymnodinialimonas ceratoperidinii]|uniref:HIRAN domain-containing protein n=1 Tax=Gymnodinialimonas ceratoperidinii TaxID=2856823 RepID=A0A8F6YEE4_9RHOB|nr:hypothetical protein [Gymnodinialimonas ceratoperidinii]QXT41137.1 hypothetical protein KYE46_08000 [Gymnodinialimonas ceratoperidinii]
MSISFWWIIGGLAFFILAVCSRKQSKSDQTRKQHNESLSSIKVTKPKGLSSSQQRGLRSPAVHGWEVHRFGDNAPVGDWVQWKIGSGWFEVKGLFHRTEEAREFLRLAARADARGEPFGALLNPEPDNEHDKNAMQVVGILGSHQAPTSRVFLGYVPANVAAKVAGFPDGMPIAVELKKSRIGEVDVILNCAGLWPPAKQRREVGLETAPPKPFTKVDENALQKLDALIERMNAMPALTVKQAVTRQKMNRIDFIEDDEATIQRKMAELEADRSSSVLEDPGGIKQYDNDLAKQVEIVNEGLDGWERSGMTPAPYYSYRIAVILSKQKEVEREKDFLAAWCRHFSEVGIGQRYADLVERARKKGAFPVA